MKRHVILHASVLGSAVGLLHTNLQTVNFQRCEHAWQSLYASCCVILLRSSRHFTVRIKVLYFSCLFVFYVHVICVKII